MSSNLWNTMKNWHLEERRECRPVWLYDFSPAFPTVTPSLICVQEQWRWQQIMFSTAWMLWSFFLLEEYSGFDEAQQNNRGPNAEIKIQEHCKTTHGFSLSLILPLLGEGRNNSGKLTNIATKQYALLPPNLTLTVVSWALIFSKVFDGLKLILWPLLLLLLLPWRPLMSSDT